MRKLTFGGAINLELLECRPFKNGCIYASYRVLYTTA
jgi:hypothetical protein